MVVFVDAGGANCLYNSTLMYNTVAAPGVYIINNGTLTLRGSMIFNGLIYGANPPALGTTVDVGGNTSVIGGISIDDAGSYLAGSSKINIVYNDAAFNAVKSYGAAGLVQNRWREFVPG
jgi:hypothetical protein